MPKVAPWDARMFGRSAALACAMVVLAVVITAATDEGGLRAGERLTRVLPLVPVCVALAATLALTGPLMRGEGRALEALGRSPLANAAGAAAGAALVGMLAAAWVLFDGDLAVRAFFPVVHAAEPYRFEAGTFSNLRGGWRVTMDGMIALLPAVDTVASGRGSLVTADLPPHARAAAALVTAIGSAAFALTMAVTPRGRTQWAAAALLATAAASAVCLQAAASARLPALVAAGPSSLLLAGAAWATYRVSERYTCS
jgi:hypothetical protein